MELTTRIAEVTAKTTYDDLSAEDVLAAKMAILDTLGVMLAGSGAGEGVEEVMGLVGALGGAEECTLVAQGAKTNPVLAALGNGALAHSNRARRWCRRRSWSASTPRRRAATSLPPSPWATTSSAGWATR